MNTQNSYSLSNGYNVAICKKRNALVKFPWLRRVYILLLLLSCLIASRGFSQTEENLFNAKIPIIEINAIGALPLEIGLKVGQKTKALFPDIEKRYDDFLSSSLSQLRFDDILQNRLPGLKVFVDDAYQKELEGIASSWSLIHTNKLGDGFLSWDEYWLLNLLPDIGFAANGTGFAVLPDVSKEGSTIIGRNLDLISTPQLRGMQLITVYRYSSNTVVNIGFAGLISVITGYNDSGLFIAHFSATPDSSYQNYHQKTKIKNKKIYSHVFALRKALETTRSTKQAANYLSGNIYGISSNTFIADKNNIQVLEYTNPEDRRIRHWESRLKPNKQWNSEFQMAVVNCHVLFGTKNNCVRAKDNFRWERLRALAKFTKYTKAGSQEISKIMMDTKNQYYEILGVDTLQSMIFIPASGHLYLYTATENTKDLHPVYQIYHQDILPDGIRTKRSITNYFWWILGMLTFMGLALWWIKVTIKKQV